jgi:hypothetical protein
MASWFLSSNFPPNGANWGHWKNEIFDGALLRIERSSDPKEIEEQTRRAHEQLVDDAPWLWIVHDGNPRAMTKKVKGFRQCAELVPGLHADRDREVRRRPCGGTPAAARLRGADPDRRVDRRLRADQDGAG